MTQALIDSAFAQETGDTWLVLLTISHPGINPSIRVVNNTESVTSGGEEFVGFPFTVVLPDQREDAPSRARLVIDNVTREVAQAVRTISTPPLVTLQVVRAEAPDVIEMSWPDFWLRNVTWSATQVSGDLVLEDFTAEPYPAGRFSPASFSSLY